MIKSQNHQANKPLPKCWGIQKTQDFLPKISKIMMSHPKRKVKSYHEKKKYVFHQNDTKNSWNFCPKIKISHPQNSLFHQPMWVCLKIGYPKTWWSSFASLKLLLLQVDPPFLDKPRVFCTFSSPIRPGIPDRGHSIACPLLGTGDVQVGGPRLVDLFGKSGVFLRKTMAKSGNWWDSTIFFPAKPRKFCWIPSGQTLVEQSMMDFNCDSATKNWELPC